MNNCSKCGMAVIIFEGRMFKGCTCDAPVHANISAAAYGKGGARN